MPTYDYKCECGTEKEEMVPSFDSVVFCECGKQMTKKPCASNFPTVKGGHTKMYRR